MNRLKFSILAVASAAALSTSAIEPLWLRDVKISPDGTHIAFTYKGDIYKVASSGGDAVRLTTQPSVEANPVWSADSKLIAFASDRFGNNDIFVIDAQGGEPRRLSPTTRCRKFLKRFRPTVNMCISPPTIKSLPYRHSIQAYFSNSIVWL